MKSLLPIALGAAIAIAISSCWVDRRTGDFACTTHDDCLSFSPSRRCDMDLGYCVPGTNPNGCPEDCDAASCNVTERTCTMTCTGLGCGDVLCPTGWDCTINCSAGACDQITCEPGADCRITCNGGGACGDIECGDGVCWIVCSGGGACGVIDCNDASCDVECSGGGACPDVDCDSACRCDVECQTGSSCGNVDCLDLDCEQAPIGCDAEAANCPTTCAGPGG